MLSDPDEIAVNEAFRQRLHVQSALRRLLMVLSAVMVLALVEYACLSTLSFIRIDYPYYISQLDETMLPPPPPSPLFSCFACETLHHLSLDSKHKIFTCTLCNDTSATPSSSSAKNPNPDAIRAIKSRIIGTFLNSLPLLESNDTLHLDVDEPSSPCYAVQVVLSAILSTPLMQFHPIAFVLWCTLIGCFITQLYLVIYWVSNFRAQRRQITLDIQAEQARRLAEKELAQQQANLATAAQTLFSTDFMQTIMQEQQQQQQQHAMFQTPDPFDMLHEGQPLQQPGETFGLRQRV
jgi:hypothetical protein